MDVKAYTIADNLLNTLKSKYEGNYSNIPEILEFWHNTMFLLFSSINHQRLFGNSDGGYNEMAEYGLMPQYLCDFYNDNVKIVDKYINTATTLFFNDNININSLRQELLNAELSFSDNNISLFADKVSRDNTGAYYTPKELAEQIIRKSFYGKDFSEERTYRIADFSCGGGDFFLAIIDYLKDEHKIKPSSTVCWFYGTDIDPIALQNCIVNLLLYVERENWKKIISHFSFGNPLIISKSEYTEETKNRLFATHRLYCDGLGMQADFFERTYDIVVGNPPWEKIRFEERKFFRGISDKIASISQKSIRDEEVKKLKESSPIVYEWRNTVFEDYSLMTAAKYKHCKIKDSAVGELNTYALFTELAYKMLSSKGFLALVVKSTLVTAPVNQKLWSSFLSNKVVMGVYLFENSNKIFCIDSRERFIVLVAGNEIMDSFEFSAGLSMPSELCTVKSINLTADDLAIINPFTNTIPNVRNNDEIAFLKESHSKFRLFSEVYPNVHFGRLIHLTAHSSSIDKKQNKNNVPVYEGKFIEQYDARYATFHGMSDSKKYANKATAIKIESDQDGIKELPESRYFVHKELWNKYLQLYNKDYSLCWRSLTSPTNRRTMLAMIIPNYPTCQSIQMLQTDNEEELLILLALFNSIPFDYFVRIKMPGLDLTQSVIKQIPVPSDEDYNEVINLNGNECTIRKHILSFVVSILKGEDRLKDLIAKCEDFVYNITGIDVADKQKMIDLLFKKAYHLDDTTYANILNTFPKYQADHTV